MSQHPTRHEDGPHGSSAPSSSLEETLLPEGSLASARRRPRRQNTTPEKGTLIGRYVILSRLGAGAMGVVMAAYDPQLDRKVALKLLRSSRRRNAADRVRLQREAQALARLNHPHVVAVHDVGVHDGRVFVAMEFVEGRTLGKWLTEGDGPRPWPEVVRVFEAAGRGLAAAHAEGLVHRDFKPENVMIGDDGRVRVMDFGLVRATTTDSLERSGGSSESVERVGRGSERLEQLEKLEKLEEVSFDSMEAPLTRVGALMGTPAYMSPEQFFDGFIDARSDQFAFCVTLYEALYGERPFSGDSVPALATAAVSGERKPAPRGAAVPTWLRRVLLRGMSPRSEERFASMHELLAALGAGEARRRRLRWAMGGVAVVAVAAGAWGVYRYDRSRKAAACVQQGDTIDEVWNDAARESVRKGLVATGVEYAPVVAERVMPWLERYADSWRTHATEACMRSEVQQQWEPETVDKAQWCLEDRRRGFAGVVESLGRANEEVVQNAVGTVARMPVVVTCVDDHSLFAMVAPPSAEVRPEVEAIEATLLRARMLHKSGKYEQGLELAQEAQQRAEALGWAPLQAAALRVNALFLDALAKYSEAETLDIQAYMEAVRSDSWDVAASTAVTLIGLVGDTQARPDEGLLWAEHAAVAIAKVGDPVGLGEANRLNALGRVEFGQAAYESARTHFEQALSLGQQTLGQNHPFVAEVVNNLGRVHYAQKEYEQARQRYEQALTIRKQMLGPSHPDIADSLLNVGAAVMALKDYERAKQLYGRALTLTEHARGARHPDVAKILNNLANIHLMLDEYGQARPLYERAVSIKEDALGPEHPLLLRSLGGLGESLVELGEYGPGIQMLERALSLDAPRRSTSYEGRLRYELALGLWKALPSEGRDQARARALMEQVRDDTANGKGPIALHAAAVEWLAANSAPEATRPASPAPAPEPAVTPP